MPRIRIFDGPFEQRLPYALRNPANQLPLHDHRIEGPPDILCHDIVLERHHAGLRIHLDLSNMTAVGIGCGRRIIAILDLQPAFRRCTRLYGPRGHIE